MQRNFHGVIRIMRLKSRSVVVRMNRIEPNALGQRRLNHRRVICRVKRAEAGCKRTDSLCRVHFQRHEVDGNRVTRLSTLDVERTGERVVALDQCERITGLLNGVAECVKRTRLENISRRKPCYRWGYAVN